MAVQRTDLLNVARIIVSCLSPFLVLSCAPAGTGRITILPTERARDIYALPDGRHILFREEHSFMTLTVLDVATGEETPVSTEIDWLQWLGGNLLCAACSSGKYQDYCIVNLQSLAVTRLQRLQANSPDLPGYLSAADAVYVLGTECYDILLLKRDVAGGISGGYFVKCVRNLDELLAGIVYQFPQPHPYYLWQNYAASGLQAKDRFVSPDGQYYYTCGGQGVSKVLQIYSQEGALLNSVTAANTIASFSAELYCHGWAWDNSGVYFQEWWNLRPHGPGPPPGHGPFELLKVNP